MTVELTWGLVICLALLLAVAVGVSAWARLGTARDSAIAAARAVLQLALVSLVLAYAVLHLWAAVLFTFFMFGVAVWTTGKRTGVVGKGWWTSLDRLGWVALAVASGIVPVLAIIFASRTMPVNGKALIPVAGIVIGNMMTANTLLGRRLFAELRGNQGQYEAGLSIGLTRADAIAQITGPLRREALVPNLDQTKTVGMVTLPGAFIGVLLGGGSPVQAAAAQVLVLIGIMAGQTVVVSVAELLMRAGKLLPADLAAKLRP